MRNVAMVFVAFVVLVATAPVPAWATFPGKNGKITYVEGCCDAYSIDVYTIDADGSDKIAVTDRRLEFGGDPAWSSNGKKIAFRGCRDVSYAGTGHRVPWFEIFLARADGSGFARVTHTRKSESNPAWSPDGQHIVFSRARSGEWSSDLFLIHPDGTGLERLTDTPEGEQDPAWSPDGQHIAFTRAGSDTYDLFLIHPDGTGLERLTSTAEWERHPRWFPDGSRLIYGVEADLGTGYWDSSVWVIDPVTRVATAVLNDPTLDEAYPVISPDGTKMAWVRGREDPEPDPHIRVVSELIVSDLNGSNSVVLGGCSVPCFSDVDWGRA